MEMLVGECTGGEAVNANGRKSNNSLKKALNVDSPSFTPSLLSASDVTSARKPAAISPKAASAAPFQPKSVLSRRFISHHVIAFFHSSSILKLEKDLSSFRGEPIAHMSWQDRTWQRHLLARKQQLQTGRWLKCKNSSPSSSKLPPTLIWWVPPSLVLLDICVV